MFVQFFDVCMSWEVESETHLKQPLYVAATI